MELSPFVIVSVVLQVILLAFTEFAMPKARPEIVQRILVFLFTVGALLFTGFNIPLYQVVLLASPIFVLIGLLVLAVIPPLSGLIESRANAAIFTRDRFVPHLATNVLGATAAAAFIWVGRTTPGFDTFSVEFKSDAAFNIVLPMTTIVILAFARWQQLTACPQLDQLAAQNRAGIEQCIAGFSLRHVHQVTNVVYLIAVTFMGAGMILYLFAFTLEQAKDGSPLAFTWQLGIAIVALLAFLFACGFSRSHQAVFLTFLTGTPAAMMVSVVWLALMQLASPR